ncbi:MAG: hypothetical protein GY862_28380, partial [Gammaproteobacteria bacterium]|nr:hypothetical protein [Gammaproteobacteria bacterium]
EIKEQKKPAEINAYLKQLRDAKAAKKLNRVRAIFIGFGAAGKTSLIRALYDEAVVEGKEKMTAGIDIREWPVPGSDIKAHLWDFGGQVMAHATHQFFLRSHCLYVVVLDARTEINANQQAEYWLEHVRAFGRNAPVLLAGNKSDLARVNLDMNRLQEDYPNIVDFYPLSCVRREGKYAPEFQRFLRDLSTQLQQTGTHQVRFSKPHFAVLEELRKRSPREAFLDKSLFKDICAKQGVTAAGALNREWLLDLFDKLGVVIHFPDIPRLEAYVLNPRWLTYGVYTLLYAETSQKRRGRLKGREAVEILQAEEVKDNLGNVLTYRPVERCYFILEAMERFQLCYRLPGEQDIFILPDLLPSDRPKEKTLKFAKQQALSFDFDFEGFLPRHLISSFIVRRHTEIVDNLVWQNGVRLRAKTLEAEALAQADYHARRLSLWVTGRQAGRYFAVLHDEIMQMLERMPDLPYDEFTGLPESARTSEAIRSVARQVVPRADFRDLLAKEAAGERKFTCKYGTYNLTEVLKIMPEEKRREQAPVQIHIEGSSIGAMNWGDISGQVANSIQQLDNSENAGAIKEALSELQKLLERSELPEQDKADALEEVQTLAVAAQDPEDKKQQSAGRKALKYLNGLAAGLPKANKLSGDLLSLGTKLAKLFSWLQVV